MSDQIKVLLVEDDTFIGRMYTKKLSDQGFDVVAATDGEHGLTLARETSPDIILLDIMLPKMDGWEVLNALKEDPNTATVPVVLLTNLGSEDDIQHGLNLGAIDYLIKAHFVPSDVVKKIHEIISRTA